MKRLEVIFLVATLSLVPGAARSSDAESETGYDTPEAVTDTPSAPPAPPPTQPVPPANPPAPAFQPDAADSQVSPAGQWVYTQQYGWVWMPYGDVYSYVPPDGNGEPYEYVYYPSYGWTWVVAPWVWGIGPWPYFGVYGPSHFGWYGHGWWRTPWRWHYRPAPAPYRGGYIARGAPGGHLVGRGFVGRVWGGGPIRAGVRAHGGHR